MARTIERAIRLRPRCSTITRPQVRGLWGAYCDLLLRPFSVGTISAADVGSRVQPYSSNSELDVPDRPIP